MERNKMFVWFNKNNNFKSHFRTSKMQFEIKKPKCSYLGDPLRVHFNTRCDHAEEHQKQPYSVSRAFALVFCWYKVIIALSWSFSSGALQHTVHSSIIAVKIVSLKFFLRAPIFRSGLEARSNKNSNTNPVSKKCRLQTGYRMQTKYKYRLQTENLCCFFVWYEITSHLTTYRASRSRFSAILFHDYLHYYGIFLARFLITIVLNIISSLHIVFFPCTRVGW